MNIVKDTDFRCPDTNIWVALTCMVPVIDGSEFPEDGILFGT